MIGEVKGKLKELDQEILDSKKEYNFIVGRKIMNSDNSDEFNVGFTKGLERAKILFSNCEDSIGIIKKDNKPKNKEELLELICEMSGVGEEEKARLQNIVDDIFKD